MAASGWLRGVVKEVHSGDTLTVAGGTGLGAPEKRLTLSSLTAPKLVSARDAPPSRARGQRGSSRIDASDGSFGGGNDAHAIGAPAGPSRRQQPG
jgi:hypothetical protein